MKKDDEMDDLVKRARAALDGIDTQVVSAARELSQEQKQNPEWVWVQAVAKRPSMSFGRWQKNSLAAPYVRLDLVLPHLDRIAALEADLARAEAALKEAAQIVVKACPKCGGEGWLWGHELNDPPDVIGHDDTKYSCDGDLHERAEAILARIKEG